MCYNCLLFVFSFSCFESFPLPGQARARFALPAINQTQSQWVLRSTALPFVTDFFFIIIKGGISRPSRRRWFSGLRILTPLLTNNVVFLASSNHDLQLVAEHEVSGARFSTPNSEATVLSWTKVECPL